MNKVYFQVIFVLMIYIFVISTCNMALFCKNIFKKSQISGKYLKKKNNIVFQH